ncbi:MAG TPA: hypothetical protein VG167_18100 [Verrucomicrobiae bacterium]|nr:hypothetical protein [Verrucomicrobiae bacterium]
MQFIADTGYIAGFWDPNDRVRGWARRMARQNPEPHLTCEAALVEACFLAGPTRIARALAEGDYQIDFLWNANRAEVLELLEKYSDYGMDAADACIVMLAQSNPRLKVLTIDRKDFAVYRTLKGKPISCEFPPL